MPEGPREWSPRGGQVAIRVRAPMTNMGNPRNGWFVIDSQTGEWIDFIEEGYIGSDALRKPYPYAVEPAGEINITPSQYKKFEKFAEQQMGRHKRGEI